MSIFLLLGGALIVFLVAKSVARGRAGSGAEHPPDYTPAPALGKTGYKRVDAILGDLRQAAESSKIPLGLLVGWVARESGGHIQSSTSLGERGYFQLSPDEAKSLGLDSNRLGRDSVYSINGGLLLIGRYAREAEKFKIAPRGMTYFWRFVKLLHSMGSGAVRKIVDGALAAGATGSWEALRKHALDNEDAYFRATRHSPRKWFGIVDGVYAIGAPFGFESEPSAIVGRVDEDILDPLDLL